MNRSIAQRCYFGLRLINAKLAAFSLLLSAAGLAAMVLIIGWQVFGRYVLNDSPPWSESLAMLILLYFTCLGTAVGVREKFHLGIVFLVEKLPQSVGRLVQILAHAIVASFGLLMLAGGAELTDYMTTHTIPTLNVSRAAAYIPFVIAGALIFLFSLEHIFARLGRDRKA